jgi:hypothetical protein
MRSGWLRDPGHWQYRSRSDFAELLVAFPSIWQHS